MVLGPADSPACCVCWDPPQSLCAPDPGRLCCWGHSRWWKPQKDPDTGKARALSLSPARRGSIEGWRAPGGPSQPDAAPAQGASGRPPRSRAAPSAPREAGVALTVLWALYLQ